MRGCTLKNQNDIIFVPRDAAEWKNKERKEAYIAYALNADKTRDSTEKTIRTFFNQVAADEDLFQMDVCDFNFQMLAQVFTQHDWMNSSTFNCYRSLLRKYSDWCIANHYTQSINSARVFDIEHLCTVRTDRRNSKYFFSADELLSTFDILCQNQDQYVMSQALFCLAWLGFDRKAAAVLRKDQVFDNEILTDKWSVSNVPDNIMSVIHRAINLKEYEGVWVDRWGTTQFRTRYVVDSEYVLRPIIGATTNNANQMVKISTLDHWGRVIVDLQTHFPLGNPKTSWVVNKSVTVQNVHTCGRYIDLFNWEQTHEEATNPNVDKWCKVVGRYDERKQCPKGSCAAFLLSYKLWKNIYTSI